MCMHYKQHMQFAEIQKCHILQNLFKIMKCTKMLKQMSHKLEQFPLNLYNNTTKLKS